MKLVALVALTALVSGITVGEVEFTSLGKWDQNHAAFLNIESFEGTDEFILVTAFSGIPWVSGTVSIVPDIKNVVNNGDVTGVKGVDLVIPDGVKFAWPNDAKVVPHDVFGYRAIAVPDGFIPPGHNNGGVYLLKMDDSELTTVTQAVRLAPAKDGYFYHMGNWVDMNGDGRKDYVIARTDGKAGGGELIWLEHPEDGIASAPWNEHLITTGPDVCTSVYTMDEYPDEIVLFAAEFFDQTLAFYRISTKDGSLVASRKIDDSTVLSAYQVALVDMNGDGKRQLLVNNHETDNTKAAVFVYTVPDDIMTGDFEKFTIANDFKNAWSLFIPNMAPGFPYAVYPDGDTSKPAHVLIAGDGDHSMHCMVPSGDRDKFEYTDNIVIDAGGTVGALAFQDLNDDGWLEVLMPNYDKGYIEVWTISSAAGAAPLEESFHLRTGN